MPYSTTTLPSLRWLLAAPLNATPGGRVVPLIDALEAMAFTPVIDLGPAVGAEGPRKVAVPFARLRSFTSAAVLGAAPLLVSLVALEQRIAGNIGMAARDLLAGLAAIVGEGPLYREVAALYAAPTEVQEKESAAPVAEVTDAGSLVDELLNRAAAPAVPVDRTAAILDAIVRNGAPRPSASTAAAARGARERILAAAQRGAEAALADPGVRAREALWRDLKLVQEQCANNKGLAASVLDGDLALVGQYLTQLADDDPMARPDVVFVRGSLRDAGGLGELAGQASEAMVPVVVSVAAEALGKPALAELVDLAADALAPAWTELRADEDTRWLAAVVNPVVHAREGARTIHGDPALTLAAMIAASHRDSGGLASLARAGSFPSPLGGEAGQDGELPAPTEFLALTRAQGRLARHGLIAIGSPRTGESLVVAACPLVHAAEDVGSLPAQILTGRIVRFALWVRGQIPPGASAQTVRRLFAEAADVSLLPGLTRDEAAMTAELDEAARRIDIVARVHPAIAGAPLEIRFGLPVASLG